LADSFAIPLALFSVGNWNKTIENKLVPFLNLKYKLDNDEATRLGLKDQEVYPFCDDINYFELGNIRDHAAFVVVVAVDHILTHHEK
jgi:hypothetical protein